MLKGVLSRNILMWNLIFCLRPYIGNPRYWASTSKFNSFKQIPIARKDIQVNFVRSSGAGGQSVNKTNSKAQARLKISDHFWIDSHMENNLRSTYGKLINKQGEIIVTSQIHKSQDHNLQMCLDKLKRMLYECSLVKEQRKFDIPPQTYQMAQHRVFQKRKKSQIKSLRQKNNKFIYD